MAKENVKPKSNPPDKPLDSLLENLTERVTEMKEGLEGKVLAQRIQRIAEIKDRAERGLLSPAQVQYEIDKDRLHNVGNLEELLDALEDIVPYWSSMSGRIRMTMKRLGLKRLTAAMKRDREDVDNMLWTIRSIIAFRNKDIEIVVPPVPRDLLEAKDWCATVRKLLKPKIVTGRQIIKNFEVSMPTLRRYVKDKKLTDHRKNPHAKNAMLMLDAVEVARYFPLKS